MSKLTNNRVYKIGGKILESKIINALLESLSLTFFRPRPIILGAVLSIAVSIVLYGLAYNSHTPTNLSTPLVIFIFGWILGLIIDLIYILSKRIR